MHLDIVVPTYNRVDRVRRTIRSILDASVPEDDSASVCVVDNNSSDGTAAILRDWSRKIPDRLTLIQERSQGSSFARNAGIRAARGDLVGFVDDDEQVAPNWITCALSKFRDEPGLTFIGGPYLPNWEATPPAWLPQNYPAAIGMKLGPDKETPFGEPDAGILMGGNAVVRRGVFESVGLFDTRLGRTDRGLLSAEDEDFFHRLMRAGLRGLFVPDLVIFHDVPAARLTKRYHRRWCFWRGVSLGLHMRQHQPEGATLLAVPRWRFRVAAAGAYRGLQGALGFRDPASAFSAELAIWDLLGLLYGRHLRRERH